MMVAVSGCSLFDKEYSEKEFEEIYLKAIEKTLATEEWRIKLSYYDECGTVEGDISRYESLVYASMSCGAQESYVEYRKQADSSWKSSLGDVYTAEEFEEIGSIKSLVEGFYGVDVDSFDPTEEIESILNPITDLGDGEYIKTIYEPISHKFKKESKNYIWQTSADVLMSSGDKAEYGYLITRKITIKNNRIDNITINRNCHYFQGTISQTPADRLMELKIIYN